MSKICKTCDKTKDEMDFWRRSNLCKKCRTINAVAAIRANRIQKPYGMNAGDVLICKTCKKEFTLKKTTTKIRTLCSKQCSRPGADQSKKGLDAIGKMTDEQRHERAKKTAKKLLGRAGKGRNAKGLNNHSAKFYELKSPDQKLYSFKNLSHFVRKNSHLFTEKELKYYPSRHANYAVTALGQLFLLKKNGERKLHYWHGWTIGDKSEKSLKMRKRKRQKDGRYAPDSLVK